VSNNTIAQPRLGKGLEALIPKTYFASGKMVTNIPLSEIVANPNQPRKEFDVDAISDLVDSIKQFGVIQPVLVRKKGTHYELIAGERRFRASQLAELQTIPAIIKESDDKESLQLALIENLQREDLNPIEKALGFKQLIDEHSFTHAELAETFGKNRSTVTNSLRLLTLPEQIQTALKTNEISEGHAKALLSLGTEEEVLVSFQLIKERVLNVRETESLCVKKKVTKTSSKSEKLNDFESLLSTKLGLYIKINGTEDRGKVEIKYAHKNELNEILSILDRA